MFIIYNCYGKKNPFILAGMKLLNALDIKYEPSKINFCYSGEYFGKAANLAQFVLANVYNISIAAKNNDILLALDEDSYSNLIYAINMVYCDNDVRTFIEKELKNLNIDINLDNLHNHVSYIVKLLQTKKEKIKSCIVKKFGFKKSALFFGPRHFEASLNKEYEILEEIFEELEIDILYKSYKYYAHLAEVNLPFACAKTAELLYECIDSGSDFAISFSSSNHAMLDDIKLCNKYYKRDYIKFPTLNLAQILLASFDKANDCAFENHKTKVNIL